MIIFGDRMYWKKDVVTGWSSCDHCGTQSKNSSYTARRWGHLYYIPLIPTGPVSRVVMECVRCSQGIQYPLKEVEGVKQALRSGCQVALDAILNRQEVQADSVYDDADVESLVSVVGLLHGLGESDYVEQLTTSLLEADKEYEFGLVDGASLEFQGKSQQAVSSYQRSAHLRPEVSAPLIALASISVYRKDLQSVRKYYDISLSLRDDRLSARYRLLTVC